MFSRIVSNAKSQCHIPPLSLFNNQKPILNALRFSHGEASALPGTPLNAFLSKSGITSRRKAVGDIQSGFVRINGKIVNEPFIRVLDNDIVTYKGKQVENFSEIPTVVLMLNKPHGFECTRPSKHSVDTIFDLIEEHGMTFLPIGRLDKNSEGLLLLTTNGDIVQKVIHPSHNIEKEYLVRTRSPFSEDDITAMLEGFEDDGEIIQAHKVTKLNDPIYNYSIVLTSGKKREVRRLIQGRLNHVYQLKRVRIGALKIGNLNLGSCRVLSQEELELVFKSNEDVDHSEVNKE